MPLQLTQRFRRQVAPYSVVSSLTALAGPAYCPALQTIGTDGLPDVDRSSVPTVLQATVSASASDNTPAVGSVADSAVTNVRWMVQKGSESTAKDITLHSEWAGHFTVGTGSDKGRLTINMNLTAGASWKIWMECDIADQRRGYTVAIPVVTDSVLIYSIADADDKYSMSLDRPNAEEYEPAIDKRLIHEYLTGLGEPSALDDDGMTYLRDVHAVLYQGKTRIAASGYTVRVFRLQPDAISYVESTASNDSALVSISGDTVTFDLRFDEAATYRIACYVGSDMVACRNYGWVRTHKMPTTDEGIVGASTFVDSAQETFFVKLNYGKGLLQYPLAAFDVRWYYRKPGDSTKYYAGSGMQQTFDTTLSSMFTNGETEVIVEVEYRSPYSRMVNASGDRYVDGSGNYYVE